MEHVRIRNQDSGWVLLDPRPGMAGCVAVVDLASCLLGQTGRLGEGIELGLLVLAQGLERVQKKSPAGAFRMSLLENRQMKDQRLARGGRGCHQHIQSGPHRRQAFDLVAPQVFGARTHKRLAQR